MPPPDPAAMSLDERRLALEERRLQLDESFAKKWAGYVFPVMTTIIAAIISAAVTLTTTHIADVQKQIEERRLENQKQIENNRAALDLYFQKLSDKDMGLRDVYKVNSSIIELKMLATVTGSDALVNLLNELSGLVLDSNRDVVSKQLNSAGSNTSPEGAQAALANAAVGLSDLVPTPASGQYKPSDFLAYPQVPMGTDDAMVARLFSVLNGQGFRLQAEQRMKPGVSPNQSEVRYYRPEHKGLAQATADKLNQALNTHFVAKPINIGKTLPNGIMEFWLGEKTP